jgi:tetrahydromethanopterin S-methyltransferase subunit B
MADQQNMNDATDTYAGFIKLFKWGTVISVLVTALVVLIIA